MQILLFEKDVLQNRQKSQKANMATFMNNGSNIQINL